MSNPVVRDIHVNVFVNTYTAEQLHLENRGFKEAKPKVAPLTKIVDTAFQGVKLHDRARGQLGSLNFIDFGYIPVKALRRPRPNGQSLILFYSQEDSTQLAPIYGAPLELFDTLLDNYVFTVKKFLNERSNSLGLLLTRPRYVGNLPEEELLSYPCIVMSGPGTFVVSPGE